MRPGPLLLLLVAQACASTPKVEGLALGDLPPGVAVDAPIRYYTVTPSSVAELRRAFREGGPQVDGRRFAGSTTWKLQWRWEYDGGMLPRCALRNVTVRVVAEVTMPQWRPGGEADEATKLWWRQFSAGLMTHERGHAQLAVASAGELHRALKRLDGGSCASLGERASGVARQHLTTLAERQAAYDRETRNGATQIQAALAAGAAF
jgi:predicted secreted Zn-dependent protease